MTRLRRAVRRHLIVILVVVLTCGASGYVFAPLVVERYVARSQVLIAMPNVATSAPLGRINFISDSTLSQIVGSVAFATLLVRDANVDRDPRTVASKVSGLPELATLLVDMVVTDNDPVVAAKLANAVPQAFSEEILDLQGTPMQTALIEPAVVQHKVEGRLRVDNVLLGLLFGLALGAVASLIIEYLAVTVVSRADTERLLGLPVLGVVQLHR